jgi:hypothetical protein
MRLTRLLSLTSLNWRTFWGDDAKMPPGMTNNTAGSTTNSLIHVFHNIHNIPTISKNHTTARHENRITNAPEYHTRPESYTPFDGPIGRVIAGLDLIGSPDHATLILGKIRTLGRGRVAPDVRASSQPK